VKGQFIIGVGSGIGNYLCETVRWYKTILMDLADEPVESEFGKLLRVAYETRDDLNNGDISALELDFRGNLHSPETTEEKLLKEHGTFHHDLTEQT
jgi:hypothetical protein